MEEFHVLRGHGFRALSDRVDRYDNPQLRIYNPACVEFVPKRNPLPAILLRDEPPAGVSDPFQTRKTLPRGHVESVLMTARRLGLDSILAA